ncbi:MAG: hypothetical protein KW793_03990 [Candidatus Doudnabacteria bacterium]|nr:hypothetical protein [Candidatus Doudnabacteria bacterium]
MRKLIGAVLILLGAWFFYDQLYQAGLISNPGWWTMMSAVVVLFGIGTMLLYRSEYPPSSGTTTPTTTATPGFMSSRYVTQGIFLVMLIALTFAAWQLFKWSSPELTDAIAERNRYQQAQAARDIRPADTEFENIKEEKRQMTINLLTEQGKAQVEQIQQWLANGTITYEEYSRHFDRIAATTKIKTEKTKQLGKTSTVPEQAPAKWWRLPNWNWNDSVFYSAFHRFLGMPFTVIVIVFILLVGALWSITKFPLLRSLALIAALLLLVTIYEYRNPRVIVTTVEATPRSNAAGIRTHRFDPMHPPAIDLSTLAHSNKWYDTGIVVDKDIVLTITDYSVSVPGVRPIPCLDPAGCNSDLARNSLFVHEAQHLAVIVWIAPDEQPYYMLGPTFALNAREHGGYTVKVSVNNSFNWPQLQGRMKIDFSIR